ncbi:MAG: hypothetical protein KDD47_18375, partial [Acidobacteria bacterium]|nr:hypothetical protein [Acidobacteriota bacterium]
GLELRCWNLLRWVEIAVPLADGLGERRIRFPRLTRCAETCSAEMAFTVEREGHLDIRGKQGLGSGGEVEASAALSTAFEVFDATHQATLTAPWVPVSHQCQGGECSLVADPLAVKGQAELTASASRESSAMVSGAASLELSAAGGDQWAFATVDLGFKLQADGQANCAHRAGVSAYLDTRFELALEKIGVCGEVPINPWEP